MYKNTLPTQVDLFKNISAHYSERKQKILNSPTGWHNIFYKQVYSKIDENIFKPLYCLDNGRGNSSVKVLISMMILKEGQGWSDKQLFQECAFNTLVMAAIGFRNADQDIPAESTYYKFRSALLEYEQEKGIDLFEQNFQHITIEQIEEFDVTGDKGRMDSKLISSNIARSSRLALILSVIKKFIKAQKLNELVKAELSNSQYDFLVRLKSTKVNKICYPLDKADEKTLLKELGLMIPVLLKSYKSEAEHYGLLKRLFGDQYELISSESNPKEGNPKESNPKESNSKESNSKENNSKEGNPKESNPKEGNPKESNPKEGNPKENNPKENNPKENNSKEDNSKENNSKENNPKEDNPKENNSKEENPKENNSKTTVRPKAGNTIPSSSLQSAHDPEAAYRSKGKGASKQQKTGFHSNITETCTTDGDLNLITDVTTAAANVCESEFLKKGVDNTEAMLKTAHHTVDSNQQHLEQMITDGGYDSLENREAMAGEDRPDLILAKTKGGKPAFIMSYNEEDELQVCDIKTGEVLKTSSSKNGKTIVHRAGKSNSYFTTEQIEQYILRQQYNDPIDKESKGLRANCEATIHQVFHRLGKRDKVKYRGLFKCNMYVLCRALWVNFSRINVKVARINKKAAQNALILMNLLLWCFFKAECCIYSTKNRCSKMHCRVSY